MTLINVQWPNNFQPVSTGDCFVKMVAEKVVDILTPRISSLLVDSVRSSRSPRSSKNLPSSEKKIWKPPGPSRPFDPVLMRTKPPIPFCQIAYTTHPTYWEPHPEYKRMKKVKQSSKPHAYLALEAAHDRSPTPNGQRSSGGQSKVKERSPTPNNRRNQDGQARVSDKAPMASSSFRSNIPAQYSLSHEDYLSLYRPGENGLFLQRPAGSMGNNTTPPGKIPSAPVHQTFSEPQHGQGRKSPHPSSPSEQLVARTPIFPNPICRVHGQVEAGKLTLQPSTAVVHPKHCGRAKGKGKMPGWCVHPTFRHLVGSRKYWLVPGSSFEQQGSKKRHKGNVSLPNPKDLICTCFSGQALPSPKMSTFACDFCNDFRDNEVPPKTADQRCPFQDPIPQKSGTPVAWPHPSGINEPPHWALSYGIPKEELRDIRTNKSPYCYRDKCDGVRNELLIKKEDRVKITNPPGRSVQSRNVSNIIII